MWRSTHLTTTARQSVVRSTGKTVTVANEAHYKESVC